MTGKRKTGLPTSARHPPASQVVQATGKARETDAFTPENASFRVEGDFPEAESRSERLRFIVRQAGGNKVVSERSGVPLSTLHSYLKGQEWKMSAALALARACGVSLEWLATGTEAKSPGEPATVTIQQGDVTIRKGLHRAFEPKTTSHSLEDETSDGEWDHMLPFIPIPRYEVKAAAGSGIVVVEEEKVGYVALDQAFLRRVVNRPPKDLVSIQASGDSMDPTIRDGDLLIVDTSVRNVANSRIYVLNVSGHLIVKRVQLRMDGSLLIKSDNPAYDPEVHIPSERNPLRVVGEVVYQAGPVRS